MSSKHIAHARRRPHDTELLQLTDDAKIAPARVLAREPKDECDDLSVERIGRDMLATRVRPVPANELTVLAQQCRWRHEESGPPLTRKKTGKRREHCAIAGREPRSSNLSPQNRELMT